VVEHSIKNVQRLEVVLKLYKKTLPNEVARATAGVEVLSSQLRELEAGYRAQDIESARLTFLTAQDVMEEAKKNKERYDNLFTKQLVTEREWDGVKKLFRLHELDLLRERLFSDRQTIICRKYRRQKKKLRQPCHRLRWLNHPLKWLKRN
jgi:multidrug resistance efflux pump